MLRRRAMMSGATGRLPAGYQETEYIRSTSQNAYINTGLFIDSAYKIKGKCRVVDATKVAYFFGVRHGSSSSQVNFFLYSSTAYFCFVNHKGSASNVYLASTDGAWHEYEVDGTSINWDGTTSTAQGGITASTQPLFLFAQNYNGSPLSATGGSDMAETEIRDGSGNLKRQYVPCYRKSDNVAGMYDLADDTFNPSAGSVAFTAGPIV